MEAWYAGKLKQQGLVLFATRTFHEDIGRISVGVPDRPVIKAFFNWRAPEKDRVKAVGSYFQRWLNSFAIARRADFAGQGKVTELPAPMRNVWAYEISGPSLSNCSLGRWEKLHTEITYVQGNGKRLLEVEIDFDRVASGAGVKGIGALAVPKPVEPAALSRLDDMFDGYLLAHGFKPTDSTQANPIKYVGCTRS